MVVVFTFQKMVGIAGRNDVVTRLFAQAKVIAGRLPDRGKNGSKETRSAILFPKDFPKKTRVRSDVGNASRII